MSTISQELAGTIIRQNGHYGDDTQVVKVVTYINQFDGGLSYAVIYPHDDYNKYESSPACMNVKTIWELKKGGPK